MKSVLVAFLCLVQLPSALAEEVVIGSKSFTESYILAEIAAQTLQSKATVNLKQGMGSTGILFEALHSGSIDVYPDYTGTLSEAILKNPSLKSIDEIRTALAPLGLEISNSLGFNNTYALAVPQAFADEHHLSKISDLIPIIHHIKAAFSYEFMDRRDGFRGMAERYHLKFEPKNVRRLEHSLAYQAIEQHAVELIEVYSTDAKIKKLQLKVLADDLGYFPSYQAVWVARKSFVEKFPDLWQGLKSLENQINETQMIEMNAAADLEKQSFTQIASKLTGVETSKESLRSAQWKRIKQRTSEHLVLVGLALLFSILIGIPLGVFSANTRYLGQAILLISGLVQTIPSLALLCFLIPVFGIGLKPALAALCLYGLLPVVLNTFVGIRAIDAKHLEMARALGMSRAQIFFKIVLPLASPNILAGVKTSAIVSIGTATLAALIGAGGYGAPIISGLALNDTSTILTGAVPAAVMALVVYVLFEFVSSFVIPKGIRKSSN